MENPLYMEVYSWENHLFRLGPSIPWLCLITRESIYIYTCILYIYSHHVLIHQTQLGMSPLAQFNPTLSGSNIPGHLSMLM